MASRPVADHAARNERLWDMVRAGQKLQDAQQIAGQIGVNHGTVNAWFASKVVARIRLGARIYSHTDLVIESLRANEDLRDGMKPKKRAERVEEVRQKLETKADLESRAHRLGLRIGAN